MSSYDAAIKELERAAAYESMRGRKKPKKKAAAKKSSAKRAPAHRTPGLQRATPANIEERGGRLWMPFAPRKKPSKKKAASKKSPNGFMKNILRQARELAGEMMPKAARKAPRKAKASKPPKVKQAKTAKKKNGKRKLNKQAQKAQAMSPAARKAWGLKMQAARRAKAA